MTMAYMGIDLLHEPSPCQGCAHFNECAKSNRCCFEYLAYVNGSRKKMISVRSKILFNSLDNRKNGYCGITNFLKAIEELQKNKNRALFYNHDRVLMRCVIYDSQRFTRLASDKNWTFLGRFGRRYTLQEITDLIEKRIGL